MRCSNMEEKTSETATGKSPSVVNGVCTVTTTGAASSADLDAERVGDNALQASPVVNGSVPEARSAKRVRLD